MLNVQLNYLEKVTMKSKNKELTLEGSFISAYATHNGEYVILEKLNNRKGISIYNTELEEVATFPETVEYAHILGSYFLIGYFNDGNKLKGGFQYEVIDIKTNKVVFTSYTPTSLVLTSDSKCVLRITISSFSDQKAVLLDFSEPEVHIEEVEGVDFICRQSETTKSVVFKDTEGYFRFIYLKDNDILISEDKYTDLIGIHSLDKTVSYATLKDNVVDIFDKELNIINSINDVKEFIYPNEEIAKSSYYLGLNFILVEDLKGNKVVYDVLGNKNECIDFDKNTFNIELDTVIIKEGSFKRIYSLPSQSSISQPYDSITMLDLPDSLPNLVSSQRLIKYPVVEGYLMSSNIPHYDLPIYIAYKDSILYILTGDVSGEEFSLKVLYQANDKDAFMLPVGNDILILTVDFDNRVKHALTLKYYTHTDEDSYDDLLNLYSDSFGLCFAKDIETQYKLSVQLNEEKPSINELINIYLKIDEVNNQSLNI